MRYRPILKVQIVPYAQITSKQLIMKPLIALLTILQSVSFFSTSQVELEARVEVSAGREIIGQKLIKTENALIYSYYSKQKSGSGMYTFMKYNNDLKLEKSVDIEDPKDNGAHKTSHFSTENFNYTLSLNKNGNYLLRSVNLKTLELKTINQGQVNISSSFYGCKLIVKNDMVYIELYNSVKKITLVCINLKDNSQNNIEIGAKDFGVKRIFLNEINLNTEDNEIVLIIQANRSQKEFYMNRYDLKGETKISSICLTKGFDADLTQVSVKSLGGCEYLLSGAYENRKSTNFESDNLSGSSNTESNRGFFICRTDSNKIEFFKPLVYTKNIVCHDLIPCKDAYLLIGEAFKRTITTVTGSAGANTGFDGNEYTHSEIISFDLNGNINWNMSIPIIALVKPMRVVKLLKPSISEGENELTIVLTGMNYLKKYIIDTENGELKEEKSHPYNAIRSTSDSDKIKMPTSQTMVNIIDWSENILVSYGRVYIRHEGELGGFMENAEYYFINKYAINWE